MKRRTCDAESRVSRYHDIPHLNVDMWRAVKSELPSYRDQARLASTCMGLTRFRPDIVAELHEELTRQRSPSFPPALDGLFPLVDLLGIAHKGAGAVLGQFLASQPEAVQLCELEDRDPVLFRYFFADDRAIVAGGFARSLTIRFMRFIGERVYAALDAAFGDVDIWLHCTDYDADAWAEKTRELVARLQTCKYQTKTLGSALTAERANRTPLQFMMPLQNRMLLRARQNMHVCTTTYFDLTCVKMSLRGVWWRGTGEILVTPLALYSVVHGAALFQARDDKPSWLHYPIAYSLHIKDDDSHYDENHPIKRDTRTFVDMMVLLDPDSDDTDRRRTKDQFRGNVTLCNMASRITKYINLGYTVPFIYKSRSDDDAPMLYVAHTYNEPEFRTLLQFIARVKATSLLQQGPETYPTVRAYRFMCTWDDPVADSPELFYK